MPKISIITPTFNRSYILSKAFASLKNQTFKDFEWIIVDDGSTDGTKELVKTFDCSSFNIRYIYQENSGKHIAYNQGLKFSTGKYILVLDSDDTLLPYALEILLFYLEDYYPNPKVVGIKGTTVKCQDKINGYNFRKGFFLFDTTIEDFVFRQNTKRGEMLLLLRKDVAQKYLFPEEKGLHFFPETIIENEITKQYLFRFIDIPVRNYQKQADSLTSSKKARSKENLFLWIYGINNFSKYIFSKNFCQVVKYYIGFIKDSIKCKSFHESFRKIKRWSNKVLIILLLPIGLLFLLR